MKSAKYLQAVENLVKAIDIAIDVVKVSPLKDFREQDKQQFILVYSDWKEDIINPEPQYANMASLKYSIDAVFTYFQEGSGQTVELFWQKIKEVDLPYKRENKMAKILKRKRIKNDIEFDFVIDVLVPYQQEGLINEDDVVLLNKLIGDFEKKNKP
jgi:hypothetical protein